jgi:hypothetical protein
MARFMVSETIETIECADCAMTFGVPGRFIGDRRNDHKKFYCPVGHVNIFHQENDEERMRRERDTARQALARLEDEKQEALRAVDRAKAETKRLKKRAAAGNCPCCKRSFSNMTEHMKKQHPKFVAAETNVVPMKAAK